jgi:hypothetical protein
MQADWETGKFIPATDKVAALARLYKKSLKEMFQALGIDVSDIPDDS